MAQTQKNSQTEEFHLTKFSKTRQIDNQLFDVWTNILIEVSASIIFRRSEFIKSFAVHFKSLYKELTNDKENVDIKYRAFDIKDTSSKDIIQEQLIRTAQKYRDDELRRGANYSVLSEMMI